MTAFNTAWILVKEYSPNWRDEARNIAPLDYSDIEDMFIPPEMEDDDEYKFDIYNYLDSGTKAHVFQHPYSQEHVVKIPTHSNSFKYRPNADEQKHLQFLESIGYPIATEAIMGEEDMEHRIQPVLRTSNVRSDQKGLSRADAPLVHLFRDRHPRNYGFDKIGNLRNFDVEQIGQGDERFPYNAIDAELMQSEFLGPRGIQVPATRILNYFGDDDVGRFNSFRHLMQMLEPVSDNPSNLTYDGKPIYLEGY